MTTDPDLLSEFEKRERHLPHWEGPGEMYFLTFCLKRPPVVDLSEDRFAKLTISALQHYDGQRYLLLDFVVMPDHVHVILKPIVREGKCERLSAIMQSLKGYLARQINELAGRRGPLWQEETYDHVIRNMGDYEDRAAYILDNPRRRGLVGDGVKWPWWGEGSG
jgi:REP element-mobilizing transposase RayT